MTDTTTEVIIVAGVAIVAGVVWMLHTQHNAAQAASGVALPEPAGNAGALPAVSLPGVAALAAFDPAPVGTVSYQGGNFVFNNVAPAGVPGQPSCNSCASSANGVQYASAADMVAAMRKTDLTAWTNSLGGYV